MGCDSGGKYRRKQAEGVCGIRFTKEPRKIEICGNFFGGHVLIILCGSTINLIGLQVATACWRWTHGFRDKSLANSPSSGGFSHTIPEDLSPVFRALSGVAICFICFIPQSPVLNGETGEKRFSGSTSLIRLMQI